MAENITKDSTVDSFTNARNVLNWLNNNLELYLILTFYIYIIAVIGIEVIRRFVLNSASIWGEEMARMMFIYLTWIGVSWGIHKRIHIRIDFTHQFLSERTIGLLYIFGDLCMLLFSYTAIELTIPVLIDSLQFGAITPALRVNRVYFLLAIPVGFSLSIVRIIQSLYRDVQDVRAGRPVEKSGTVFGDEEIEETPTAGMEVNDGS